MAVRFSTSGKILFVALQTLFVPQPHWPYGIRTDARTHIYRYRQILLMAGLSWCDTGNMKAEEEERKAEMNRGKVRALDRLQSARSGENERKKDGDGGEQMEGNLRQENAEKRQCDTCRRQSRSRREISMLSWLWWVMSRRRENT